MVFRTPDVRSRSISSFAAGQAEESLIPGHKSACFSSILTCYEICVWLVSRVFFTLSDVKSALIFVFSKKFPYQSNHCVYIAQRFDGRLQTERNFFPDGKAKSMRSA